jgi:hypothetical protein
VDVLLYTYSRYIFKNIYIYIYIYIRMSVTLYIQQINLQKIDMDVNYSTY